MTVDLVTWLKDALDEDQRAAEACINEVGAHRAGEMYSDGSGIADYDAFPSYPWGSDADELAYMAGPGHPARVLAEVAAKRAILKLHEDAGASQGYTENGYGYIDHCCGTCGAFGEYGSPFPCATLRTLVEPYRDRAGFDPSWLD